MRRVLAVLLVACAHPQVIPPTSLACKLTEPPPPWYVVEESNLPACVEVGGFEVAQAPCCPDETVCLTLRGGQALLINKPAFMSWTTEAWLRCRVGKGTP